MGKVKNSKCLPKYEVELTPTGFKHSITAEGIKLTERYNDASNDSGDKDPGLCVQMICRGVCNDTEVLDTLTEVRRQLKKLSRLLKEDMR